MPNGTGYSSDIARSMGNVLGLKQQKLQNILAERKLRDYGTDRDMKQAAADIKRQADAIKMAMGAPSREQAKMIIGRFAPEMAEEFDYSRVGDDISLTMPGGVKMTGPSGVFQDALENMSTNPQWWTDQENVNRAFQWAMRQGASIEMPEQETVRLYNKSTDQIEEGTKDEMERKKMRAPHLYETYEERAPKPAKPKEYQPKLFKKNGKLIWVKPGQKPPEDATPYEKPPAVAPGEKQKSKEMESIKSDYFQAMGRYYSAKRGVGQFIADPNKEQVAKEAMESANNLARRYRAIGGNLGDLGLDRLPVEEEVATYKTADDVKKAYKKGDLAKEEAAEILRTQFGYK